MLIFLLIHAVFNTLRFKDSKLLPNPQNSGSICFLAITAPVKRKDWGKQYPETKDSSGTEVSICDMSN